MYDQARGDILFVILYSVVMAMALLSGCYLLFSKANAFVPDITPPRRLRRWTGVFLASVAVNQVWCMRLFFLSSNEDIMMADLVGGLIQSVTILPVAIVVLLAMLQDRRRPLWPEIPTILAKLTWLKKWLKEKAPAINALKPKDKQPYHWVYTNKFAILPNSKYARQLAQINMMPVKQWDYNMLK